MKNKFVKVMIVSLVVCFAVSLFAFSVSADEVIFNGTITKGDENGNGGYMYDFPSYVPLENGITYEFTALDQTVSGIAVYFEEQGVCGYIVDIPGFGQFGSIPSANLSQLSLNVGVYPDTIDLVITSTGATDQSQDVVVFNESLPFEKLSGDYSVIAPSDVRLIADREYLVEVNGIERQYTAVEMSLDGETGVVLGLLPPVDGEISVTTTNFQGTPTIVINADNLLPGEGTYPVKITLLGIKPSHFSDQIGSFASNMFSVIGISASSIGSNSILSIFLIGLPLLFIVIGILFTLLNRKKNRGRRGYYKRYKRR